MSTDGGDTWKVLDRTVDGRTQDEGKTRASRMLEADDTYGPIVRSGALALALSSARSWKPERVLVKVQPSKFDREPLA